MSAPDPTRSPPSRIWSVVDPRTANDQRPAIDPRAAPIDPPTQPLRTVPAPGHAGRHPLPTTSWSFVDVFAGLGVVLLLSLLLGAPLQFANVKGGSAMLLLSA